VFLNYILHWGALRFYALLKGALTEKSLRKADLGYTHAVYIGSRLSFKARRLRPVLRTKGRRKDP